MTLIVNLSMQLPNFEYNSTKPNQLNMKKTLLFLSLFVFMGGILNAQTRYVDNIFTDADIYVEKDVKYSENYTVLFGDADTVTPGFQPVLQNLLMDIYVSDNDTVSTKPLIILMHSGSFLPRYINNTPTGYKDDSSMVAMCMEFAKKGYTVASMSYRMGWDPRSLDETVRRSTIINAAYKGVQDVSACIRWFKDEYLFGNLYGIDTTMIVVGGQGTGSYMSAAFASLDDQAEIKINKFRDPTTGDPMVNDVVWGDRHGYGGYPGYNVENNTGHTTEAALAFGIGGALGDTSWMDAGEIPFIWAHSVYDPFAPYTTGMVNVPGTTLQVVEVSGGYDIMKRCESLGNTAPYKGKIMDAYTTEINKVNDGIDGLYPFVGVQNASGPYEWYDTMAIKQLPSPPYDVNTILGGIKASNPLHSKMRALKFIDTITNYFAPRIAISLGLIETMGISKENLASNVTVAPNPATNQLIIHNNWENNDLTNVVIRNMNGQQVLDLDVQGAHNVYQINLTPGIYMVGMEFQNGIGSTKLVVK